MNLIPCIPAIINQRLHRLSGLAKLSALACLLVLSACSLVVPGYNNAPNLLMFFWINPHVDLNAAQEKQTLADLKLTLEWHRQNQLPVYADVLKQMQDMVPNDINPDQVCAMAEVINVTLDPLIEQFEVPLTKLALSLNADQLQTLQRKYEQDLKDYRKEWKLDAPRDKQLDVQTDKGQTNSERLYGSLSNAQEKMLRQLAQDSGYEPERTYAERMRQQKESMVLHERILQTKPDAQEARALVRKWLQSSLHSSDPAYAAYLKKRKRTNCEAAAQFHNLTTAKQREHAVKTLKNYEADVRALMRYKAS